MSKIVTGKVLRATRATYEVMVDHTVLQCTIRGKLSVEDPDYRSVRVGDNVTLHRISDGEGVIESVLPRTSQIERNIESRQYQKHIFAVNIDQLLIILSTQKPAFKSGLLDRYLVISEKYHIPPIICINKMDLSEPEDFLAYQHYYSKKLNYPLMFTSAQTGEGIDSLTKIVEKPGECVGRAFRRWQKFDHSGNSAGAGYSHRIDQRAHQQRAAHNNAFAIVSVGNRYL
ncbi:MAG: GTPase RsgA [Calditrichia bacterium]